MLTKYAAVKLAPIKTEDEFNKVAAAILNEDSDVKVRKIVKYNPDFVYARFKAIGAIEVDGPNANADAFPYGEFLDNRPNYGYQSFIGKHAFVEHASDNINNSIGDLYHSYLNRFNTSKFGNKEWPVLLDDERAHVLANREPHEDGSIDVLMAVDRKLAPKIARMVETDSSQGCSMGTNIDYSECTVCGNRAYTEEKYCPHIRYSKGQYVLVPAQQLADLVKKGSLRPEWLPWILQRPEDVKAVKTASRKMVYARAFELNYGLSFFDLSLVANPAFTRGYKLEKVAAMYKPSAQLMPLIRIADNPVETLFKVSDGYFTDMMNSRGEEEKLLLQRSGEVAKTALTTGNVHEVLVGNHNAPQFVKEGIELTDAETPGFYKLVNPEVLLDKTFTKTRSRSKMGVVGTVEEDFYACANCLNVFERNTQKHASIHNSAIFETFSICPDCEKAGIQHKGDVIVSNEKKAEYPTLPSTAEYTGDKEVVPGEGAFVGEKDDLYRPWAEKGSKQIEKEKEYRPMGTIFTDPIVAKSDLNARSTRINELSKSALILLSRVKLAIGAPGDFLKEMKKDPGPMGKPSGLGGPPMDKPKGPNPLQGAGDGTPDIHDPLGEPSMGGALVEIDMTPESAPEILDNVKADLEFVLSDLQHAKELVDVRETEASQALERKIRWSRRFVDASVRTVASVDELIADAESAVNDALAKLQKACDVLQGGSEQESTPEDKEDENKNDKKEDSGGSNPFGKPDENKPPKGDNKMANASLELTEGNIALLQKLRETFAAAVPVQKVAEEEKKKDKEDEKKEDAPAEKKEEKKEDEKKENPFAKKENPFAKKEDKEASMKVDAAAQPPTGARDPGNYGEAGKIESHEMSRWWSDMYPEFEKMKATEKVTELNEPDGKVKLLTGFVGNKTPDNPEVGKSTQAPTIFAKRFMKTGPKFAESFIGVVKLAEDGSTEAFTANLTDLAGPAPDQDQYDEFVSDEYLDSVINTVATAGMNTALAQMRGKVSQLEGITPGKTEKVNPLYDTKEEKKDSNTGRAGIRPDEKDGHGSKAGDKEYFTKAYGDPAYASDLVTANTKIASLTTTLEEMEIEKRSNKMADYALHMARIAASRGVCPFDLPSIYAQAKEYIGLDEKGVQIVKAHLQKLPILNMRALEAYQIPEAENMQKGVIHNTVNAVDKVRMEHASPEDVAPDGIQPSVEQNAHITADQQERVRKQAAEVNSIVPQMHAGAPTDGVGIPDVTRHFNTIENRLKRIGAYEENKHFLHSNRRQ